MGRNDEYKSPFKYSCGCGYASRYPVILRHFMYHVAECHQILVCYEHGGDGSPMACMSKECIDRRGWHKKIFSERCFIQHLEEKHGLDFVVYDRTKKNMVD